MWSHANLWVTLILRACRDGIRRSVASLFAYLSGWDKSGQPPWTHRSVRLLVRAPPNSTRTRAMYLYLALGIYTTTLRSSPASLRSAQKWPARPKPCSRRCRRSCPVLSYCILLVLYSYSCRSAGVIASYRIGLYAHTSTSVADSQSATKNKSSAEVLWRLTYFAEHLLGPRAALNVCMYVLAKKYIAKP